MICMGSSFSPRKIHEDTARKVKPKAAKTGYPILTGRWSNALENKNTFRT